MRKEWGTNHTAILGDEAIPSVVGYTKVGEKQGCSWVFKKEHLALHEVVGLFKRIDTEKKEEDSTSCSSPMGVRSWWAAIHT